MNHESGNPHYHRALVMKYVLQRYQIDPTNLATYPEAQQIVMTNLKELKPWLMSD